MCISLWIEYILIIIFLKNMTEIEENFTQKVEFLTY